MKGAELGQITRAVAAGDCDALQLAIVHYHARLRAAVSAALDSGTGRRLDPEDVLQEAYASAFEAFGAQRFESAGRLYRWLETIALNELKNQRRAANRQKRDVRREVHARVDCRSSYPDLIQHLTADQSTPSSHALRAEAVATVMTSLARLTPEQRLVVRLRFLESRSVGETASRLERTEPAIHALCYRALKQLRGYAVSLTRYRIER